MTSSPMTAARSQTLLDLLAPVPDPRKRRGRRHPLAGLRAVGVAAVIAGSRSFAVLRGEAQALETERRHLLSRHHPRHWNGRARVDI